MSGGPVTLDELVRVVDKMEERFNERFTSLDRTIQSFQYVRIDTYRAERNADQHRINELESDVAEMREDKKWLVRAVVLAIATSVILPLILTAIRIGSLGGAG